jgi:hypothetical protein
MSIAASAASAVRPVGGKAAVTVPTLRCGRGHAFVLISAEPSRIATLAQQLSDLKGIGEVYSVAGDEDLVAIVASSTTTSSPRSSRSGSPRSRASSRRHADRVQAYSKHDLEAMWSIGWE